MRTISTNDYFRVDLQDHLPECETHRRRLIKERLEEQYEAWQDQEKQQWLAITQPNTVSFLGLDWTSMLPFLRKYVEDNSISFALVSELQLSTIRPALVSSIQSHPDYSGLYELYRRYAICIYDFGNPVEEYRVPIIDAVAAPCKHSILFECADSDLVSNWLPLRTSTFRVLVFPQTRYSFIDDEIFQALYPLPEEEVKVMSSTLLTLFQGPAGYYNGMASPFADSFLQYSYDGTPFHYLAALYPVIELEYVSAYRTRKRSEHFLALIQRQKRQTYPAITQWRYSRRFDFAEETQNRSGSYATQCYLQGMQSARGLFEYSCGDLDTVSLDLQQTSLVEEKHLGSNDSCVLQIDSMWLLMFVESQTICVFRNERRNTRSNEFFEQTACETGTIPTWCEVLLRLINTADERVESYESLYHTRLAKLQFRIHTYNPLDYALVKDLSGFVAEITIFLDPLLAQTTIIRNWQQLYFKSDSQIPHITHLFQEAISTRETRLSQLKKLQERAKESQSLLFQLSNTETAHRQSNLAKRMAEETTLQVALARKAERQNKAILIFTIVTVIFLPLSFFTSYFGMNTSDVREMHGTQNFFWAIAGPLSFSIVALAMIFAFRAELRRIFWGPQSDSKAFVRITKDPEHALEAFKGE